MRFLWTRECFARESDTLKLQKRGNGASQRERGRGRGEGIQRQSLSFSPLETLKKIKEPKSQLILFIIV